MHRRLAIVSSITTTVVLALALVGLTSPASAKQPTTASTPQPPAPLTPTQIASLASPALDFIDAKVSATISFAAARINSSAVIDFGLASPTVQNAFANDDVPGAMDAILQHIADHPSTYVSIDPTPAVSVDEEEEGFGSGWTVTPDGYIVTNAHVGAMDPSGLVDSAFANLSGTQLGSLVLDAARQLGNTINPPYTLQNGQIDFLVKLLRPMLKNHAQISGVKRSATIFQDGSSTRDGGMPARLVTHGTEWPGKDVAILKVDGHDMPTLALGDEVMKGDRVYAVGYPYNATFNPYTHPTVFSATISQGDVSNRLESTGGYKYIEHTATMNHDSSGGALVDADGRAVGITTAHDQSLGENGTGNGASSSTPCRSRWSASSSRPRTSCRPRHPISRSTRMRCGSWAPVTGRARTPSS